MILFIGFLKKAHRLNCFKLKSIKSSRYDGIRAAIAAHHVAALALLVVFRSVRALQQVWIKVHVIQCNTNCCLIIYSRPV